MNEIEKEIDNLGRVVIPIGFRNKLGIKSKDKVLVSLKEQAIVITAAEGRCLLCGIKLSEEKSIALCTACIEKVKSMD